MPRGTSKATQKSITEGGLGGYFNGGKSERENGWRPVAKWSDIDPSYIMAAIANAEAVGVALLFGKTRDGSSLALGIFKDGQKNTFYFLGGEGYEEVVQEWLWKFAEDCQAVNTTKS